MDAACTVAALASPRGHHTATHGGALLAQPRSHCRDGRCSLRARMLVWYMIDAGAPVSTCAAHTDPT